MSKEKIVSKFSTLAANEPGLVSWLTASTDPIVFDRLARIEADPLRAVELNQLLTLSHEAPTSLDFYRYYWKSTPPDHPFNVKTLTTFDEGWLEGPAIRSLDHLYWGLYRIYVDSLLYFGNIRTGYRQLRALTETELIQFFRKRRFDTEQIRARGPSLPLRAIPIDERYLISEMACKSYGDGQSPSELRAVLLQAFKDHAKGSTEPVTIKQLLSGDFVRQAHSARQTEFQFSADDALDDVVGSEKELTEKFQALSDRFSVAREAALENSRFYLSMVGSLDVYVATSMRTRDDFRSMGKDCETIFFEHKLRELNLRYFNPTLSAASGHEDKGLIECLMVRCAKVLVFCAGEKDSYGKDAEAAMALSQGKPVIFYCNQETRSRFYRDVHPLSRLIEYETGVAVGAIVTDKISDVSELLWRLFENKMEYELEQPKPGYFRLRERLTGSVVRLQTNDRLLAETFWNHYHNRDSAVRS